MHVWGFRAIRNVHRDHFLMRAVLAAAPQKAYAGRQALKPEIVTQNLEQRLVRNHRTK
jgi:hypothetical protein